MPAKSNLLAMQSPNGSDFYQTPPEATELLLPYLDANWTIWEPASGQGAISNFLAMHVRKVIQTDIIPMSEYHKPFDFLSDTPSFHYDCIVTNPPYSRKDEFLARCYALGKPFALLLPLNALGGQKRGRLFWEKGVSVIIPDKRINFITYDGVDKGACWFPSAWFTWGLGVKGLSFVKM
jgi:hypothetical protein